MKNIFLVRIHLRPLANTKIDALEKVLYYREALGMK
jgi:hypothetical protein